VTGLRRTLTLRFSGTMFVALSAIALWAYLGVRHTLHEQLDRSLRSAVRLLADEMVAFGAPSRHKSPSDPEQFARELNRLIVVRDSTGGIVAANTALARRLPLDTVSLTRARRGDTTFVTSPWLDGHARAVYMPGPPTLADQGLVLQVGASLQPLHDATRTVLYRMIGTVLLGTLATLIGASWLARSAVAPVNEIASHAAAVTGSAAGERITVHADVTEFTHLISVLNGMLARLERANHRHRRVIRDLGHDLRTPITAMRAGVEVALRIERTPDEYRRVLASALEDIDRLILISDALVLLGRLESGELTPNTAPIDAWLVAGQAVGRAQQRAGARRFMLAESESEVLVCADPRLLSTVLDQLLDNAMRYTPPGATVEVSAAVIREEVELVVEDDGPGVPEDLRPHLFERFYRTDAARGGNGGPGLGLTLAAAIVELHQGTILAEQGRSGGLRIRIRLPRRVGIETPHILTRV
jgi:two-component system OmpR family sensor kinase